MVFALTSPALLVDWQGVWLTVLAEVRCRILTGSADEVHFATVKADGFAAKVGDIREVADHGSLCHRCQA